MFLNLHVDVCIYLFILFHSYTMVYTHIDINILESI